MARLADLAKEISSKNAGAFSITFDIVFDDSATYTRVKEARVITAEAVAAAYGMPVDDVLDVVEFDQGNAFKVAVRRTRRAAASARPTCSAPSSTRRCSTSRCPKPLRGSACPRRGRASSTRPPALA